MQFFISRDERFLGGIRSRIWFPNDSIGLVIDQTLIFQDDLVKRIQIAFEGILDLIFESHKGSLYQAALGI